MLLCFEPVWFWWRCNCSVWTLSDLMGLRVRVYLITGTFHWDQWSWSWALWAELDQNRSDVTPGSNHSMFLIGGNFCWSPAPFWELCPFLSSACFGINIPALFLVALLVVWFWSSWIMDPDPFSTDTTAGWVTLRTRKTDPGSDCQNVNSVQLNFTRPARFQFCSPWPTGSGAAPGYSHENVPDTKPAALQGPNGNASSSGALEALDGPTDFLLPVLLWSAERSHPGAFWVIWGHLCVRFYLFLKVSAAVSQKRSSGFLWAAASCCRLRPVPLLRINFVYF